MTVTVQLKSHEVVFMCTVSGSLTNGSSATASRTSMTSSHSQSVHTSRVGHDSELAGSDKWQHESPLARDEMSRHRCLCLIVETQVSLFNCRDTGAVVLLVDTACSDACYCVW